MTLLRWIVFALLATFGSWIIICNWAIAARRLGSLIPVIGGVSVAVSLAVIPWASFQWWWWVPLILDLGSAPLLLLTGGYFAWRALRPKK